MNDGPQWCPTCGTNHAGSEPECPACVKWWDDNPPPADE